MTQFQWYTPKLYVWAWMYPVMMIPRPVMSCWSAKIRATSSTSLRLGCSGLAVPE